ncbi:MULTISPECIES: amidase [Gordonia]|jgi:Asp-tRNA(Asn)/Glu-tRNA(Gln) amidotransferase A subunit family amidase|uniref:amidase n=1 Tax=Gordonia alkanivorans CGMCC 6845 TaxID=1423140 RepID=W9DA96_9ACTN|nr:MULTISPECIES: amidase [Gordonia]ETA05254.1 amidase [Gordonia alkanivorans CGMCC 6845]MDH3008403.1 amidase [Gordonia alkanivorans]MDH3013887.1 amidase [Gordonia alkanivorans]MDH3015667.1 amidase [Gordonia alkanivorans]MDH3022675.1 amidase [Gordonia alkanivorans]
MADQIIELAAGELTAAYRARTLSPVEVTEAYLDRIAAADSDLRAFITVTDDLAREQARASEARYAAGAPIGPLDGVPTSVKDAFYLSGVRTTLGSKVYEGQVAKADSGVVRRLRAAGAVFTGKTNTAEFGQSATSENMLGPDTVNPWDVSRTPGGSSGGAAASVAARLSTVGVGSDGGGSIRIPAAFCGVYGLKPSPGLCPDEKGFRGMTDFVSAGPMTNKVTDARVVLGVLADREYTRNQLSRLRVGYCPRPEGRAVDPGVVRGVAAVAVALGEQGHDIIETDLPLDGWNEIFGPLVLEDEHRERGHLLADHADQLSRYERSSLRAALALDPADVERARVQLPVYRRRIAALFEEFDVLLTPSTAIPAFPLGERPAQIDGADVDALWGAFPFAVPFNVAGASAASVPCGLSDGLPIGAQLVTPAGAEELLLDLSEDVEIAVGFDGSAVTRRWTPQPAAAL